MIDQLGAPVTDSREIVRLQYKPNVVRVLFVGESLAAGGTFFYYADSILYRYIQRAFSLMFGNRCGTGTQFLEFFKELGFYFDDLCKVPVNRLAEPERKKICRESVPGLAARLRELQPSEVVALLKRIESEVREATRQAGLSCTVISVPFPNQWYRDRFVQELSEVLQKLKFGHDIPT